MLRLVLLISCVFTTSLAPGATSSCTEPARGVTECVVTDDHPSGQRITREWHRGNEPIPYRVEIQGARSGTMLPGELRLIFIKARSTWVIQRESGSQDELLRSGERMPKVLRGVRGGSFRWDITVSSATAPIEKPGVATEDEPKLNLRLVRR